MDEYTESSFKRLAMFFAHFVRASVVVGAVSIPLLLGAHWITGGREPQWLWFLPYLCVWVFIVAFACVGVVLLIRGFVGRSYRP